MTYFYEPAVKPQPASVTSPIDTDDAILTYWGPSAAPPKTDPHIYPYLMNEPDACTRDGDDVRLLVVVTCRVEAWRQRLAIRRTWGTYARRNDTGVKMIFLIGVRTSSAYVRVRLRKEREQFHDIVQVDFHDSYRNLSIKSVAMLKWAATYCANATYVLKADDDVFVNIPNLLRALDSVKKSKFFLCSGILRMPVVRNKKSKWYVSIAEYVRRLYPDYCSGTAYAFSTNVAAGLFARATRTPLFWLEDVFVTGLLRRAQTIALVAHARFERWGHNDTEPCHFKHRLITAHEIPRRRMEDVWQQLQQPMNCTQPQKKSPSPVPTATSSNSPVGPT